MASKTTTKKTKSEKPIVKEETVVKATESIAEAPAPVKKAPKKFAPDERIECRSVTGGELILVGPKTQLQYSWADYNDTAWVEHIIPIFISTDKRNKCSINVGNRFQRTLIIITL